MKIIAYMIDTPRHRDFLKLKLGDPQVQFPNWTFLWIASDGTWGGTLASEWLYRKEPKTIKMEDVLQLEFKTPVEPDYSGLNEVELADDYPVYWDMLYVADGKLVRSDIKGTIRDLKRDLISQSKSAKVITTCDIVGRKEILDALDKA